MRESVKTPAKPEYRARAFVALSLLALTVSVLSACAPFSSPSAVKTPTRQAVAPSPTPPPVIIKEYPTPTSDSGPFGIEVGPDGNLWFRELNGGRTGQQIGRITPSGVFTEFANPAPQDIRSAIELTGLVGGPDGNMWFTEALFGTVAEAVENNGIGRITPSGAITVFPVPTPNSLPEDIVVGPDGNLWFTESLANQIGRITPSGAITEYRLPIAQPKNVAGLDDLTTGPDGNIWFIAPGAIGRITPSGTIKEFPISSGAGNLVAGPDGNLWFTSSGAIGHITPSGAITKFSVPTPQNTLTNLIVGPDGVFWYISVHIIRNSSGNDTYSNSRIGRITLDGAVTEFPTSTPDIPPAYLVVGPGGDLWFTESDFNHDALGYIGRVTPQGVITLFPTPTPYSGPTSIVAGPDGNLWFTEGQAYAIGRITP